jgi:imidazolonepropionase
MLWKNIKGLVGAYDRPPLYLKGREMRSLPVMERAWLAIEDGVIVDFGSMDDFPGIADWSGLEVMDCEGKYVLPAWCDSHTHLVFAARRSGEFLSRLEGKSYQEIAAEGGGILNSARALQAMSEEELLVDARERLQQAMRTGTGSIEIKSGYGLTAEAELKMLRVINALKEEFTIPIKATFLACHAVPEGEWTAASWAAHMIEEALPVVASERLADYVDAFCEKEYFGLEETQSLLDAATSLGLKSKVHVNQFNAFGGVKLCVNSNAVSVDHLEELNSEDVEVLKHAADTGNPTIATALPGCSYFLGIPYTPVHELMKADVPVALATDFNPGSAPSSNMNRVVQLAILKMKMHPLEAIAASTINGAAAMECSDRTGVISRGRAANVLVTRPMNGLEDLAYDFGEEPVEKVFIDGIVQ